MIEVSKLTGYKYFINAETIDFIEETPDTTLTLASGKKVVVKESAKEIIDMVIAYKQKIYLNKPLMLAEILSGTDEQEIEQ